MAGVACAVLCAVLAACGGGNTISGTFTEGMYAGPGQGTCAHQENAAGAVWKVRVAADNVTVGTVPVQWSGNPHGAGCTASWSMSVPAASKAYQVTLVAACALSAPENITSVTVQPQNAGNPVRLSDAAAGGDNC